MRGGQQNRIPLIGRPHRGRVPGATNHQLGRHPMGEPAGGVMGCATGAGADLAHRGAAVDLPGIQGNFLDTLI